MWIPDLDRMRDRGRAAAGISAFGQKQTSRLVEGMSAIPPKTDIRRGNCDICFVPKAAVPQYQIFK
jgi:hypothetical protein